MSNDDKQQRIDDYLLGRADEAARREFEEEVTRDAELSEGLADTELAMDAIEYAEDAALKARLQNLEASLGGRTEADVPQAPPVSAESTAVVREMPAPHTTKAGVRPRRNLRRLYGIAAAVLVLLLAGWFVLQPRGYNSPEALAMATFEPYENITPGGVRGGEADPATAAFAAYDAGDYATAATALRALPPTAVNRFYLGQSLLATGDYAAAAVQFADVRMADFGLTLEAEYYLAVARLGEGKTGPARDLLKKIAGESSHPLTEKAQSLLAEVDKLD